MDVPGMQKYEIRKWQTDTCQKGWMILICTIGSLLVGWIISRVGRSAGLSDTCQQGWVILICTRGGPLGWAITISRVGRYLSALVSQLGWLISRVGRSVDLGNTCQQGWVILICNRRSAIYCYFKFFFVSSFLFTNTPLLPKAIKNFSQKFIELFLYQHHILYISIILYISDSKN
jgi:hypothetical protein